MRITIRSATDADLETMRVIFSEAAAAGDTIPSAWPIEKEAFARQWSAASVHSFVAVGEPDIVGMAKLGPNQPDRGSHVSTATFVVRKDCQGRGVGRSLVEHCLSAATKQGYRGMQFNFVVSSNIAAVRLYESLGFTVVGTVPGAFNHRTLGYVDAFVMYRKLNALGR